MSCMSYMLLWNSGKASRQTSLIVRMVWLFGMNISSTSFLFMGGVLQGYSEYFMSNVYISET